jgi:DNA polymerase V
MKQLNLFEELKKVKPEPSEPKRWAIAHFVHRAAEKLRHQKQSAQVISVFARTSPFKEDFYADSAIAETMIPTNDTMELLRLSASLTKLIFREGLEFKKAGVILTGLLPEGQIQGNLFDSPKNSDRADNLMQVIDKLNAKYGRNTVKFASAGIAQPWITKSSQRSPRYTTSWHELLIAT